MSEGAYGFGDCSDGLLERLLAQYEAGIANIASGRMRWDGGTPRQLRKWRAEVIAEILLRRARIAS